jgi:hypothetical protein
MVPRSNLQPILLISSDFPFFFSEFHRNALFSLLLWFFSTTAQLSVEGLDGVSWSFLVCLFSFFVVCSFFVTDLSLFVPFTFLVYLPPMRFHSLWLVSYCSLLLILVGFSHDGIFVLPLAFPLFTEIRGAGGYGENICSSSGGIRRI